MTKRDETYDYIGIWDLIQLSLSSRPTIAHGRFSHMADSLAIAPVVPMPSLRPAGCYIFLRSLGLERWLALLPCGRRLRHRCNRPAVIQRGLSTLFTHFVFWDSANAAFCPPLYGAASQQLFGTHRALSPHAGCPPLLTTALCAYTNSLSRAAPATGLRGLPTFVHGRPPSVAWPAGWVPWGIHGRASFARPLQPLSMAL